MLVLITYDVNTEDAAGRKRLRQIARQCVNYGQRVQNSVFECLLDTAQSRLLQAKLRAIDTRTKSNTLDASPLTSRKIPSFYRCKTEALKIAPGDSHLVFLISRRGCLGTCASFCLFALFPILKLAL